MEVMFSIIIGVILGIYALLIGFLGVLVFLIAVSTITERDKK